MMHHALQIQEILLNIFDNCHLKADLASLARTCRAFKEPALDALWGELYDLSPLAQCLPDKYSFSRPLTQTEWDILQTYTRRIQSVLNFNDGLDQKSITILSNPSTTEPLFPNLRYLRCKYETQATRLWYRTEATQLLRLPFPSLTSISVTLENPRWFQDSLESFSKFSPNVRSVFLGVGHSDVAFSKSVSNCICRWQNIQYLFCPRVTLDADALVHLSRMPMLTCLNSVLSSTLPTFDTPIPFSSLQRLDLYSGSLGPISSLLSQSRPFAITDFVAYIDNTPSRQGLCSFFASVHTCNGGHTIKSFRLEQSPSLPPSNMVRPEAFLLDLEVLWPSTAFSNLNYVYVSVEWNVGLKDGDLLALASAWPHLKSLRINEHFGWNRAGGITPNGLLQLLQKCRLLYVAFLAIDTRGYTELPPRGLLASLMLPRSFCLNVLDSIIEVESVPAVVAFLARTPCSSVSIGSWHGMKMVKPPGWEVYRDRWVDMRIQANGLDQRS